MAKEKVYTAVGTKVLVWEKIHIVKHYSLATKVIDMLVIGDYLFLLETEGKLSTFNVHTDEELISTELAAGSIFHPSTYINKILYVPLNDYSRGTMILFNFKSQKELYRFNLKEKLGKPVDITTIEQSPVVNVIGVGTKQGSVLIFNILTDKLLFSFEEVGQIVSLSFSSIKDASESYLVTGTSEGNVTIWDLNKKTIFYAFPQGKPLSFVLFVPNEPLLLTASALDNSLKMYSLNETGGFPVLIKQRKGHSNAPFKVRFYGEDERHLISLNDDCELRNLSLYNEHQSFSFSWVIS